MRAVEPRDRFEWLRTRAGLWPDSASDHAREIAALVAGSKPFAVFVAEEPHGGLVGFIEVGASDFAEGCRSPPVALIEGWRVDARFRRSGIGRDLVDAGEAWAKKHGCTEIASDAELSNAPGHAAHAALGYQVVERAVCFRKAW